MAPRDWPPPNKAIGTVDMDAPALNAESLHRDALARIESGDLDKAHAMLLDVVRIAPDSLAAYSTMVRVSQQLGRLSDAKYHCERMVELAPGDVSLVLWLGWLNFELGCFDEAKNCADYAESAAPDRSADAQRLLVFVCGKSGDWRRASVALEKLSALQPESINELVAVAFGAFADHLLTRYRAGAFTEVVDLSTQMPIQFASTDRAIADEVAFAVSDSFLRVGQYDEAMRAIKACIPASGVSRRPRPPLASARSLCLVTSLMPSRLRNPEASGRIMAPPRCAGRIAELGARTSFPRTCL